MKTRKLLSVILAAIIVISCFGITSFAAAETITVSATSGYTLSASNAAVENNHIIYANGGSVTYTVTASEAGTYNLKADLYSNKPQWTNVVVNGVETSRVGSEAAFTSGSFTYDFGNVELVAGENTIVFQNGGSVWLSLYSFTLTPVSAGNGDGDNEEDVVIESDGTIKVQAEGYNSSVSSGNKIDATSKAGYVGYYNSSTLGFKLDISEAGLYKLAAKVDNSVAQYDNLLVNGVKVVAVSPTTSDAYEYGLINLTSGENTIQFFNQGNGNYLYMDYFTLKKVGEYTNAHTFTSMSGKAGTYNGGVRFWQDGTITYNVTVPYDGKYKLKATLYSEAEQYTCVTVNGTAFSYGGRESEFTSGQRFSYEYATVDILAGDPVEIVFYNGGEGFYLEMYGFELERIGNADPIELKLSSTSATITNNGGNSEIQAYSPPQVSYQVKDALSWDVTVPYSGTYDISVEKAAVSGQKFNLYIDDTLVTDSGWLNPEGTSWSDITAAQTSWDKSVDLTKGSYNIKIELPSVTTESGGEGNGACVFQYLILTRQTEKETEPTIIERLVAGNIAISVNTEDCWLGTETLYAAVYHNNKLKDFYMKSADGGATTIMHLKQIVLGDGENISDFTFKLFMWDGMTPVVNEPSYTIGITTEIYVTETGSEDNDGTQSSPVNLAKAKTLAREASVYGDVVVNIGAGEYTLTSPLSFTAEDCSSNGAVITYMGTENGETVLNGGKKVDNWNASEISNVYVASVDVSDLRQLWVNGQKAVRATSGYLTADAYYDNTDDSKYSVDGVTMPLSELPAYIVSEPDLELVWNANWSRLRFNVNNIVSDETNVSFVMDEYGYAIENFSSATKTKPEYNKNFRIENALCYLDEPGEFYYNKSAKLLYYYPKDGENLQTAECYVGVSEGLIDINGASNLNFENLTLKYGTWLRPNKDGVVYGQGNIIYNFTESPVAAKFFGGGRTHAQVEVKDSSGINFKNVDIANVGSAGYSFTSGVTNSSITDCDITDTAAGGIMIGSWRTWEKEHYGETFDGSLGDGTTNYDRSYSLCKGIKIVNNVIADAAHEYGGQSGIDVYYTADTQIDHNTLSNLCYTGISYGYGWSLPAVSGCTGNTITGNYIYNYLTTLNDGGAIYTLGKSGMPVVSDNYIVSLDGGKREINGLYADQGTSGAVFKNNVVEDCNQWLWVRDDADIKNVKFMNNYSNREDVRYANTTDTSVAEITGTVYDTAVSGAVAVKNASGAGR